MNKRLLSRIICLMMTGILLSGVSTAIAAESKSPYELFKDVVFAAFTYENATMESVFTLSVNGNECETQQVHIFHGNGRQLTHTFNNGQLESFDFQSEALRLRTHWVDADGTQWYSASLQRWDLNVPETIGGMLTADMRQTNEFRLVEAAIDLVVGDIANNFRLVPQGDGTNRISWNITQNEIPEIIEILIDMYIEQHNRWSVWGWDVMFMEESQLYFLGFELDEWDYYEDFGILDLPIESLTINRIHGYVDIDNAGNLINMFAGANVTIVNRPNLVNTIDVEGSVQFFDIGITEPLYPIRGAMELFTAEFMEENFERHDTIVYFNRNIVGTINRDSITNQNPRWGRHGFGCTCSS